MNTYQKLAKAVFWLHMIWITTLLGGIPISYFLPWFILVQMVVVTTTAVSQILWLGCPLVALENALRAKCDPAQTYSGSFICHYLKKRFGIKVPPIFITAQLIVVLVLSTILWIS